MLFQRMLIQLPRYKMPQLDVQRRAVCALCIVVSSAYTQQNTRVGNNQKNIFVRGTYRGQRMNSLIVRSHPISKNSRINDILYIPIHSTIERKTLNSIQCIINVTNLMWNATKQILLQALPHRLVALKRHLAICEASNYPFRLKIHFSNIQTPRQVQQQRNSCKNAAE